MEQHLIKSIYVEKLFGLYTYDFDSEKLNSSAVILYGDNGVGKSTLLRLAFHLLSPANNGGHRTALYTTNFELLKVELTSGYILTAKREEKELGHRIMVLDIIKDKTIIARWNYRPDSPDGRRIFINDEVVYINDHEIYESFSGTKIKNPSQKILLEK